MTSRTYGLAFLKKKPFILTAPQSIYIKVSKKKTVKFVVPLTLNI